MVEEYTRVGDKWYYLLHPRPVYIVASGRRDAKAGFMAASWLMPLSEEPPRIVAALEKTSHTTSLVLDTGAFTVNVYGIGDRDFVYTSGTISGRKHDKVSLLNVRLNYDTVTGAPRIVHPRPLGFIDSRVYRVVGDVADDVYLVIGDVVGAYADKALFNERYGWDLRKVRILMHAAGRAFTSNSGVFVARKLA
ncbi:MAG: flavin reductase family protein [Hyperthermus sp.]|nr:MAG: flavin reductase family protein [Hyperthermus sp.]